MNKIKVPFSPPDITEEEINAVTDVLRSGWITTGPKTKEFERKIAEFCNIEKAVCLNSATACLEMALRILGIGAGDEVITSAYTYTATASVIAHVGAKIVLVDTQKDSYNMDFEQLEKAITEKTKAIILVDLAGIIADYDTVFEIVRRKQIIFKPQNEIQKKLGRIAVCADAAHAFGAVRRGKRCGEIADFTSFSFHAVKNLTTGEGGALVWKTIEGIDNQQIYQQLMLLSLHGQSKDALSKTELGAWEYDVVGPFYKCNMTDIMASIGLVQLKRYPELLLKRKALIEKYNKELEGEPVQILKHYTKDYNSSGHLYIIRLDGKTRQEVNEVIERMAEYGIATNVHYKPLPLLSAYNKMGFEIKNFPKAAELYENTMTLPLHTKLSENDVELVTATLKKVCGI